MTTRVFVCLASIALLFGCSSSSSNNDASSDAADGKHDTVGDTGDASDAADRADVAETGDVPIDQTSGDQASDRPDGPDVAETASTETGGNDAPDGGAGDAVADARPQGLRMTILVTDQIGGDGGLEVGPNEAGATDGGADADASGSVTVDPNLVNPWGLAFNPSGPLWVADNHSGVSTVYDSSGMVVPLVVTVPTPDGGMPPAAPTGLVFNGTTTVLMGDKFVFSTEDGTISGWQTGATAVLRVDNSAASAVYKGLALMTSAGTTRLFATDFHNAKVDVFDQNYASVTAAGGFTDATVPAGFAPFGIQGIGTTIYVTYALQDAMKEDDDKGPGRGYVDAFDFDGHLVKRVVSQGALNSPWAVALAPADFGAFSGALMIGNFGDGMINAYNAATGAQIGTAQTLSGSPLSIDGLWSLVFGNDTTGAPHNRLFFTAGPHEESHGLLGYLDLP